MCAPGSVSRETTGAATGTPCSPVSRETDRNPLSRALTAALLLPLRAYRRWLSPALPARCRYYPSCSAYAEQALRELGPLKGTIVAGWRLLRCNPLSSGGLDPLDNRRLFRSGDPAPTPDDGV